MKRWSRPGRPATTWATGSRARGDGRCDRCPPAWRPASTPLSSASVRPTWSSTTPASRASCCHCRTTRVEDFHFVMNVNVFGIFNVLREAARRLRSQAAGRSHRQLGLHGRGRGCRQHARLQRLQGRGHEPHAVGLQGLRAAGHPRQRHLPRASSAKDACGTGRCRDRRERTRSTTRPTRRSWRRR